MFFGFKRAATARNDLPLKEIDRLRKEFNETAYHTGGAEKPIVLEPLQQIQRRQRRDANPPAAPVLDAGENEFGRTAFLSQLGKFRTQRINKAKFATTVIAKILSRCGPRGAGHEQKMTSVGTVIEPDHLDRLKETSTIQENQFDILKDRLTEKTSRFTTIQAI